MFKSNTEVVIRYRDPNTFAIRGVLRVKWCDERKVYTISLWKTREKRVALHTFREWEDVVSYIEKIEYLSKENSAFLAIATSILENNN